MPTLFRVVMKKIIIVGQENRIFLLSIYGDAHTATDKQMSIWGQHAMKDTPASEIIPELKPEKNDIVIEKKWGQIP